jgi:hypothetical protein
VQPVSSDFLQETVTDGKPGRLRAPLLTDRLQTPPSPLFFTKSNPNGDNECLPAARCLVVRRLSHILSNALRKGLLMPASGELIRMMNYIDDIAATLRRVNASLYLLSPEDKQRLAEYMRKSDPNFSQMVDLLEHPE